MSEPANNPQPAPAPENTGGNTPPELSIVPPPTTKRSPGQLNKSQAREVEGVAALARAAQQREAAAQLQAKGLDPAFVAALLNDCTAATGKGTVAMDHDTNSEVSTREAEAARKTLVDSLCDLQSAGRQLHQHTSPEKLKDYLVGDNLTQSQEILAQSAQTIVNKANAERPPSVDTDVIVRVQGEIGKVSQAKQEQEGESATAQTMRAERDALVEAIKQRGQQIKLGADRAWPPGNPANAGMRRKFRLPANRRYAPRTKK